QWPGSEHMKVSREWQSWAGFVALLGVFTLSGCGPLLDLFGPTPGTDLCEGVTCSGHGSCQASGDVASCNCASGFSADGLDCIADPPRGASLIGQVVDALYGSSIDGARVQVGAQTYDANEQGYFTISDVTPDQRVTLLASAPDYARGGVKVIPRRGEATFVRIALLAFSASDSFDAATGGTVTSGSASVTFPAGALAATGPVTVSLAVLDPSSEAARTAFPGGFETSDGGMLESFGALGIEVTDASGQLVNLAAGQNAQIVIPVTSGAPDSIPLWSFNETTGAWVEEGSLGGCADGVCDSVNISHLSWWNADQVLETTCVRVCVHNQDGSIAAGVSVYASGYDYNGDSSGTTGDDGCLCLEVKRASTVSLSAFFSGGVAGPVQVTAPAATAQCGDAACYQVPDPLIVSTPKFQAVLSWSEQPSDLDSHFTGPCDPSDSGCTDRFHVYYSSPGALAAPPWAVLDTDDTTSFGPEIVTLAMCLAGTYRYAIHNYSGSPGIETSLAKVFLTLPDGSNQTVDVPTSNPDASLVWIVGDLTCRGSASQASSSCDCTWQSRNTFGPADDTSYNP
ncbi:MAG: hypothetical protein ABIJ09_25770, partial [Pseudomonadota bacterium]